MSPSTQIVISASRRTDIPAFYMDWFMKQIKSGLFKVVNPFNRQVSAVSATPDDVHTIVFWSKNFGPFIKNGHGDILQQMGYHLFFNFTINSESKLLEPKVPPLTERLHQLEYLCNHFGARCVNLRFDPICFFKTAKGRIENNLKDFTVITDKAHKCGIKRCITSFMDHYPKIKKRIQSIPGFHFIDPDLHEKIKIVLSIEKRLEEKNIPLMTCCEKDLVAALPPSSNITNGSCIPNDFLVEIFGGNLSLKKDSGQRIKSGCGCKKSTDIGSYHLHPCYHNCLFCYANPVSDHRRPDKRDSKPPPARQDKKESTERKAI